MEYALLFIIGLLLGGLATWSVTNSRLRNVYERQTREAATRAAAAEATTESLCQQHESNDKEIESLRARLESEQRERSTAEAHLQIERKNLEDNRRSVDEARQKLS